MILPEGWFEVVGLEWFRNILTTTVLSLGTKEMVLCSWGQGGAELCGFHYGCFQRVVITFELFCFRTPLDAWMWLKRNGWIRWIWCIFFFEATRFMHSQHACDNNSPCIPLYKSLWKAGAGPDQRANPEENFSRVWAVPRCGQLPSIHGNNRLLE